MLWRGQQGSSNILDNRGGTIAAGGGGCLTLILAIIVCALGGDPSSLLDQGARDLPTQAPQTQNQPQQNQKMNDEMKQFVSVVLKTTEEHWRAEYKKQGKTYKEPRLVLFTNRTDSACGRAGSSTGPFYCPGDDQIYIDLGFFQELKTQFKAAGDFAQAYVIAHEVGHHVQNLMGTTDAVDSRRGRVSEAQYNELSKRLELQADFYAGMWARYVEQKGLLEVGDIEEAMRAASAVGDDTIQRRTQGYIRPESFTHGSSEQRMRWFMKGYKTGDIRQGDTFKANPL